MGMACGDRRLGLAREGLEVPAGVTHNSSLSSPRGLSEPNCTNWTYL